MKCPSCQFENPEGMQFCGKCASKLELICPNCNFSNPPDFIFCGKCAHNLSQPSEAPPKELSFDEKIEKIQKYLPKGLTEKILSQRDRIEGENKQVTVMFADMEGFTSLVEKLGPEEAYSIMDEVYEILIHKVHYYEGTVNEMTGDGIMALFGAPIALEDAPQRAIRSAYAIHREMTRFNDRIKKEREDIPSVKLRIGIHTGPVVVGTLGNDLKIEFKAVGDTVNLASRMEDLAEPGATYVTEETFKLTEGLFRYESLGEMKIKGKEKSVRAYRVIGPSTRRTRFDVNAERGLTPFLGRERELEILLDAFDRVKGGRGQAISIISEAGVGKSRLLYEFRKAIINEDMTFLEGKCLSYSRGVTYHPVIDVLKSNFDVQEDDGDYDIREKIKRQLKLLGIDEASTLPYLLELLSVRDSSIDQIFMSPEARKNRIIEAINRITLKGSEIRPLVIAFEDLHWSDKSSEEYLKNLLDSISGAMVLLIFTYRPEFVHTWGGKSYHSQITLNRLSNRESLSMVNYLLGTEDIDSDLENLILEKTEGVPFFIEEFVKSLKDLKVVERKDNRYHLIKDIQDLSIPSTIQDVIMARVDSLSEGAKEVLQTGSVIEREFSYELIRQVMNVSQEDLLSRLSILKESELLYERGVFPQSTYIFKHALTLEVVYDSLLTSKKRGLHEKIGNAIEEIYRDNLEEHYELLAQHYITSEDYEKGAQYCKLAERKAEKGASFNDAADYGEKRIFCLEKLPGNPDIQKKIIRARTTLGLYYIQLGSISRAKNTIDPIIDVAFRSGYKSGIARIYNIIGHYNINIVEDLTKGLTQLDKALTISEEMNDMASMFFANFFLSSALCLNCEFEKAAYHLNQALDINVNANNLWGVVVSKSPLSFLYNLQGSVDLGYKISYESLKLAEELDYTFLEPYTYLYHGTSFYFKGILDEAERYFLKGLTIFEKTTNFYNALTNSYLGQIYYDKRQYQNSQDHFIKSISLWEHIEILPSILNVFKISLKKAKVMNEEKDIDLESLNRYEGQNKVKVYESDIQRSAGEILLNIDDFHMNEAEDWINKAIGTDEKNGMIWHLGRDYALYAELFKRKADKEKAKENLTTAIQILKECGADGWVEKYEEELASL